MDIWCIGIANIAQRTLPTRQFQGGHQGGGTVACLLVIVVQRAEVLQFIAHHAQHIVVEQLAVTADDGQRFVGGCLDGGQPCTGSCIKRDAEVIAFLQLAVVLVDLFQHDGIDRCQCLVFRLLPTLLHTLHGGLQRVGTDDCHRPATSQFGGHQLSELPFLLRLLHNLHQHIILRAQKVVRLRRPGLLPKRIISLSLNSHTHQRHQNKQHCSHIIPY